MSKHKHVRRGIESAPQTDDGKGAPQERRALMHLITADAHRMAAAGKYRRAAVLHATERRIHELAALLPDTIAIAEGDVADALRELRDLLT